VPTRFSQYIGLMLALTNKDGSAKILK
jgi:hypothetical protein